MYGITISILKESNPQLWFTISLRLGKILLEQQSIQELDSLITELKNHCKKKSKDHDGDQIMSTGMSGGPQGNYSKIYEEYDSGKSNLLLETFALEI